MAQHVFYYTHTLHTTFCVVQIHYYEMFHVCAMKLFLHNKGTLAATNSVIGPGHRFVFANHNLHMLYLYVIVALGCTTNFVVWF